MTRNDKVVDELIHDVKSKCATLSDGSEALRKASPETRQRLLSLMLPQAKRVLALLSDFDAEVAGK